MEWDLLPTCERSEPENVHQGKLLPLSYMHYLMGKKFLLLPLECYSKDVKYSSASLYSNAQCVWCSVHTSIKCFIQQLS